MSTRSSWKSTPYGQVALYIGGVKFAVPALALAAIAMIWGTWIDSTVGRDIAFARVYGASWFVALMALICASLILSVAVRYPWRKKHIGFIIVHASLVSLIAIGFYTMRTKIEGRIILEEGRQERSMQLDKQWLQVVEHTSDGGVGAQGRGGGDGGGRARAGGQRPGGGGSGDDHRHLGELRGGSPGAERLAGADAGDRDRDRPGADGRRLGAADRGE
jgi:uncharacterized membrane protein YgcG